MLAGSEYPGGVRFLRAPVVFLVGVWTGMAASAALAKRIIRSRGDSESNEVTLAAIFDGIELESSARAFSGGSMLSWFGGVTVDLRQATLAPDAHLDVHALFGGIAIRVPPGWRVVSNARALAGGVAVQVPEPSDDDAPTLTLDGFALFGGVAVVAKERVPELSTA